MSYIDSLTTDQIAANARALKAEFEAKKAEYDFLAAALAVRLGTGTHNLPSGSVNVAENNTYPQAGFGLTPGQVERCMTRKWNPALAAELYPAQRAAAKVTNGWKVTLR